MRRFAVNRAALVSSVVAALLAACGGWRPPIGAPRAMPQSRAVTTYAERDGSWMLPEAKSEDLIYALGPRKDYIVSYATGNVIASFNGPPLGGLGLCSDEKGNVFIPGSGEIWEYTHGGTKPMSKLRDPGYRAAGCGVDPISGDLAVANVEASSSSNAGNIAIFEHASGQPKFLSDPKINEYLSCTYDDAGNLFLDGFSNSAPFLFAELPAGSNTFTDISLNKPVASIGSLQWDGQNIAVAANNARLIYRVSVTGSTATVIGITRLDTINKANFTFWVQGGTVLTASGATHKKVGLWDYPRGGKPVKQYGPITHGPGRLGGITVSVARGH